ncbi:MAG: terminase large subunit [Paracoccus sp. (in: a-proteobacteria)]|nr:terminase large subunit [Paracoccus sp. (in: a-proteobacteria)]
MKDSTKAMQFLQSLRIPEGPKAGDPVKLAPFQRQFVKGALDEAVNIAVLSIGRGNAKTALSSGIALGSLLGEWDRQPKREILIAARTRDQARIAWQFVAGFAQSLPDDVQKQLIFRRSPRLEIEFEGDGGGHFLRAIAADGKSALGTAPTLVLMDERGHWPLDRGDDLEHALLSGLGKRGGKGLLISTSAPDDSHPFSRWIDDAQPGVFVQEHRPPPGLPADDRESLITANPGARYGIGANLEWLEAQARRAMARGGGALTSFRLYNRNERVSGETRDLLLTVDEWLSCEVSALPPRQGPVVIGIDLGGSASMSAAAFYWPETSRLECRGTFPASPSLADRGAADGVSGRYMEMQSRGELNVLGDKTVPPGAWLADVMRHVQGETVAAITADRYKQAELAEGMDRAGVSAPVVWRGQGFRDGGEDCERFRRAVFDGLVKSDPSLLLRSAFADAVTLRDPANNLKLAKARSKGRIDAAAATVLAVAEGARMLARPRRAARMVWG